MDKGFFYFFSRQAELFDKKATLEIILFEVFVIFISALLLFLAYKKDKKVLLKYGIVCIGVLIFESFTHPLWLNEKLGAWSYTYLDVSWV
ncbi:MAG: hypothetical protein GF347_04205, partial [Candidatus Moranbacteria bacterium]|nr:hypothetical protein [Candidatus Moranbacteria bacterium]